MATRHKRTWSAVDGGRVVLASGYWASIVKLKSERSVDLPLTILDLLTGGLGWFGSDPRYRILIGREGTEQTVGVREARKEPQARKELAEVVATIANASESDVRALYDLAF